MLAKDYRAAARETLSHSWGTVVLFTMLYMAIEGLMALPLLGLLLYPLLEWGYVMAFYERGMNRKEILFSDIFSGFKTNARVWGLIFLRDLYTALWSLLLIVPGIVKAYSYSMAVYILRENPELTISEALKESQKLMDGHKGTFFCTHLTLAGWWCLSILTCGIGFLWLIPYAEAIKVEFYKSIKPVSYISVDASTVQGTSTEL